MQVDFAPSPELYPFQSRWLDSRVGRVHYLDEGAGRPLIFFHGNPTWSFLYRHVILALRDRFRCIALDYPGFGLSDHPETGYGYTAAEHAQVAGELLRGLDLEDAVIVGQDWGGPIGLGAALDHPDRVTGLAFGNTWFWPADHVLPRGFSWLMSTGVLQSHIVERNLFVERLLPLGTARYLDEEVMEHYRGVVPTPASRTGIATLPRQIRDAAEFLGRLESEAPSALGDRPSLFFWGEKDPLFPMSRTLPRWRRAFPNSEVVSMPEASHFVQEDAPETLADALAARFSA